MKLPRGRREKKGKSTRERPPVAIGTRSFHPRKAFLSLQLRLTQYDREVRRLRCRHTAGSSSRARRGPSAPSPVTASVSLSSPSRALHLFCHPRTDDPNTRDIVKVDRPSLGESCWYSVVVPPSLPFPPARLVLSATRYD